MHADFNKYQHQFILSRSHTLRFAREIYPPSLDVSNTTHKEFFAKEDEDEIKLDETPVFWQSFTLPKSKDSFTQMTETLKDFTELRRRSTQVKKSTAKFGQTVEDIFEDSKQYSKLNDV